MPKSNIFIRKRYLNLKSYKSASESLLIIVFIYDRNNINVFTIIDCHSCALQRLVLFNKCMHAPCCLLSPQALFKIDDKNLTFPAAFPKLTIPSFWPDIIVTRLYTFHFFWSQFVCRVQNNVCHTDTILPFSYCYRKYTTCKRNAPFRQWAVCNIPFPLEVRGYVYLLHVINCDNFYAEGKFICNFV